MTVPGRYLLLATALLAAALMTGCATAAPTPTPTPTETPVTSPTTTPTSSSVTTPSSPPVVPVPPSREGQPADEGAFAALTVPAGVRFGVGVMPAVFTPDGAHLHVGDVALVNGTQCGMGVAAALLVSVDEISEPLTGPDRDQALTGLGYDTSTPQIVQRVVLRIRQIGGTDPGPAWRLSDAVSIPNYGFHEPMPLYTPAGDTPLDGHGVSTGDTVQVVLYAAGTPDELTTYPLEAVQLRQGCRTDEHTVSVDSPYLGDFVEHHE